MLDDAFQAGTDAVLEDMVRRPRAPKPQEKKFSVWGLMKAPALGATAGAAQVVGSSADILGAFGDVLATTEASGGGMFATMTPAERTESVKATEKLVNEGVEFRQESGQLFRNVARDYMPDPVTAHGAETAVAEFFRMGSKAIGAAVTMGPLAGAAAAGLEDGFSASDDLAEKGVDLATRTKVGAVTAATNAASFALPVAGKTVAGTVGLALSGGPVAFVAQQAATREILRGADYSKLADQYDPLDPVGLALSTLVPLGFGALAMRGAAKAAAAKTAQEAAAAERAVMASDTPPSGRTPVAMAVDEATIDAARVNLLREVSETTRLTSADDMPAAAAHETAMARAIDQMAAGERVDVADVAPVPEPVVTLYHGSPHEFDAFDSSKIGTGEGAQAFGHGLYLAESEAVARFYRDTLSQPRDSLGSIANSAQSDVVKYWIEQAGGDRAKAAEDFAAFAKDAGIDGSETLNAIKNPPGHIYEVQLPKSAADKMLDWDRPLIEQPHALKALKDAGYEPAPERTGGEFIQSKSQEGFAPYLSDDLAKQGITGISYLDGPSRGAAAGSRNYVIFPGNERLLRIASRNGNPLADFADRLRAGVSESLSEADRLGLKSSNATDPLPAKATPAAEVKPAQPEAPPAADGKAADPQALETRAEAVRRQFPDLMVQMDGMDKPMRMSEFLDAVKREADAERADAPDYMAAAECALLNGQ